MFKPAFSRPDLPNGAEHMFGLPQPLYRWDFASNGDLRDRVRGVSITNTRGSGAAYVGPSKQLTWVGNYFTDSVDLEGADATNLGVTISGQKVTISSGGTFHRPREDSTAVLTHKAVVLDYVVETGDTQWVQARINSVSNNGGRANFDLVNGVVGTVADVGTSFNTTGEISALGTGPNGGAMWRLRLRTTYTKTITSTLQYTLYFLEADDDNRNFSGNGTNHFWLHRRHWVPGYHMPPYVVSTAGANLDQPRFVHDPVTGEALGFLAEPAATNLLLQAIDFSDAAWGKTNTTITQNDTVAPDGTKTADKIQHTTALADIRQISATTLAGTGAASIFIKKGGWQWFRCRLDDLTNGGDVWFDITNGVVGTQNAVGAGTIDNAYMEDWGDWWRIVVVVSGATAAPARLFMALSDADGSLSETPVGTAHIWGVQVVAGTHPSTLIITDTAQVTRATDVPTLPDTVVSRNKGAIRIEVYAPQDIVSNGILLEGGASSVQGMSLGEGSAEDVRLIWRDGADRSDVNSDALTDMVPAALNKILVSYDIGETDNATAFGVNGEAVTPSGGAAPGQLDFDGTLNLGRRFDASLNFQGIYKRLEFYDVDLSEHLLGEFT